MENNFYVGVVCHNKRIRKNSYKEKVILHSNDGIHYTDLVNDITYNTDSSCRDYVIKDSLLSTDISEYKTDYLFLLLKHNSKKNVKRRKIDFSKFN